MIEYLNFGNCFPGDLFLSRIKCSWDLGTTTAFQMSKPALDTLYTEFYEIKQAEISPFYQFDI